MKKTLSLILVMMSVVFSSLAQESNSGKTETPIVLLPHPIDNSGSSARHRAPMRINIEAYYNEGNGTLNICYDGEAIGEVYLYLNNIIVGYDSDINTSFQISTPGLYKIEIISEAWIAEGYIPLQ